jgi:hypothetical protein
MLERARGKIWVSGDQNFSGARKKSLGGMHETLLTYLSIGQYDICSTLYLARRHRRRWLQKRTTYSPLLSASQGAYATFSRPFFPVPAKFEAPCPTPSSLFPELGRYQPNPDSSRASPRIASLPLVYIADKPQVLPHHSDSIPAGSVMNGLQPGSYAPSSQG